MSKLIEKITALDKLNNQEIIVPTESYFKLLSPFVVPIKKIIRKLTKWQLNPYFSKMKEITKYNIDILMTVDQAIRDIEANINQIRGIDTKASEAAKSNQDVTDGNFKIFRYHRGLNLLLDITSLVDFEINAIGTWEENHILYHEKLWQYAEHKPNMFLDIGAYFGLYALAAYKSGIFNEIYTFEADKYNFMQLLSQQFLNRITSITNINKAVSNVCRIGASAGSVNIKDGNRGATKVLIEDELINKSGFKTEFITLDSFFPCVKNKVIFIKMDVEGHEAQALEGMKNLIANNEIIIQIETFNEELIAKQIKLLGLKKFHKINVDSFYTNVLDKIKDYI